MTESARTLLSAFDALPPEDQHEATIEICRRVGTDETLPDASLVEAADELFRLYDAEETARASGG